MPREPAAFPTEVLRTPPITSTTPSSPQPAGWEHRGRGFPTGGQVNVMALVLPTSVCHLGPPPSALPPHPPGQDKTSPESPPTRPRLRLRGPRWPLPAARRCPGCARAWPPAVLAFPAPRARAQVPEPQVGTAWQPGPFPAAGTPPQRPACSRLPSAPRDPGPPGHLPMLAAPRAPCDWRAKSPGGRNPC